MSLFPKTFEYPYPNKVPQDWLESATRLWNDGLHILEWRQHWLRLQKCLEVDEKEDCGDWDLSHPVALEMQQHNGSWGMVCRIGRDQRIDKTKSWDKDNVEFRPCCQVVPSNWLKEPPINGYGHISLKKPFTAIRGYDSGNLPSGLVQSVIKRLASSWEQYLKGVRGKPRYRGKKNPITSLDYDGFRHHCKLSADGTVKLLGMSSVKVHGLKQHLIPLIAKTAEQLKTNPTEKVLKLAESKGLETAAEFYAIPGAYCLLERDGKTYLQISGQFYQGEQSAGSRKIAITTGTEHLWKSDAVLVEHQDNEAIEARIKKLQVVLSSKEYGSSNWQKVKAKITKLHRQAKMRTRRHQQFNAQWLAQSSAEITIESYVPSILPAPLPRPDGEGGYLPNQAEVIAEENTKRAKSATAQFVSLIKEKAEQTGAVLIDKRKQDKVEQESLKSPQADVKQPKSTEHGQSRKRQQGGKGKTDSQISQNAEPSKSRGRRNRKRERAIG